MFYGPRKVHRTTQGPIQFNRDVRPILSATCYRCHGPDESHREADLRLDNPEDAFAVIVPSSLAESELWKRISSHDPDVVMPPPDAKLELTPEQIDTLRRWIQQGAEFQGHWSFIPPQKPARRELANREFVRNPIDLFVLDKLKSHGLKPSTEADRRTFIRRATFD